MTFTSLRRALLTAPFLVTGVCAEGLAQTERRMLQQEWVEVGGISAEGTALLMPLTAYWNGKHLLVFDDGDQSLKAFSLEGQPAWSYGREGQGPGEFRYVRSIDGAGNGATVIYDAGSSRLTWIDNAGRLLRTASLSVQLGASVVPLPGGRLLAQAPSRSPFVVVLDSLGDVVQALPIPFELSNANPIQSQGILAPLTPGVVLLMSLVTDRFYVINTEVGKVRAYRGVTPRDYPEAITGTARDQQGKLVPAWRPSPDIRYTGIGGGPSSDQLLILNGNAVMPKAQVVDAYDARSGTYRYSFLLPQRCASLTIRHEHFVCMQQDPAPGVVVWMRALPAH